MAMTKQQHAPFNFAVREIYKTGETPTSQAQEVVGLFETREIAEKIAGMWKHIQHDVQSVEVIELRED